MTQMAQHTLEEGSISDADFSRIAGLVREMMGIDLQPHKRTMVASRLSKRLRATGYDTVDSYIDYMLSPQGQDEQTRFVSAYTTNMTRFNREGHHFEQLANDILPDLMNQARKGKRVRIWSAGCSSGEEPYGLAFNVLDACPEAGDLDVKILATDIDTEILATAKRGVYPASSTGSLPNGQGDKYFMPVDGSGERRSVNDKVRDLISFRRLNLHGEWPFKGKFDIIMCRNVAIYFDAPTQSRLWQRFGEQLCQNGLLFIGHSEGIGPEHAELFTMVGRGVFSTDTSRIGNSTSNATLHMGNIQ
ncbi:protein-glutamate O-methyltransferase [Shimia sp. R11_0]|uniref:CheR family methyltransferase n=1 Tax=Shimia sp. R11_0 TaxID=2821096 RepID=UPI001AD98B7E|nr:protein-glutamate O-methyltransferase [Shimia sp. R11_0]MBO9478093.1 protein-glutamate O-methyltransferase [Shimia sp. R11_0]